LADTFAILKPHVETLRQNRQTREMGYMKMLLWETGTPPRAGGTLMRGSTVTHNPAYLESMVPGVQRMISEIGLRDRYADCEQLCQFIDLMRRRGVAPDPGHTFTRMTLHEARGPGITDEQVIRYRWGGYVTASWT